MALTISARKNTLTGQSRAWRFHTSHEAIVSCEDLIDLMAGSRTTLSKPDLVASMALLTETIAALVAEGKFVKTPLGDFYLCAVGTIDKPGEAFTPGRAESGHGFRLRFRPDRSTEAGIARSVRLRREDDRPSLDPLPLRLETPARPGAGALRPGDLVNLAGYRLKFDPGDPGQGLFLVRDPDGARLRCPVYARIRPSLVIAQLPADLPSGSYRVLVRSAGGSGAPREGWMEGRIEVEEEG